MPITGVQASSDAPSSPRAPGSAPDFGQRLQEYRRWREDLYEILQEYQAWIEQHGLGQGTDDLALYELLEGLKSDKLTVALVAEFSRGKTELINAIFFADYKQRLLPSAAGRTTMCPTELMYDPQLGPCVRLLPIETRKTSLTIAEYRQTPVHWTTIHIHKLDSAQELSEAFGEIVRTKKVSLREAHELGLYQPAETGKPIPNAEMIEVPVWRHAVINFPHPLLKEGLVVLDTPGLNSLGAEPELTFSMLPRAHAVMFVLAADTGVTKSDLAIWTEHVCRATSSRPGSRIAILNKIDRLWDELQDVRQVSDSLARQISQTASALGLRPEQVFPVSAQKGLLGKIKNHTELLERSGLPAVEKKLAEEILPAKQRLLREKIARDLGSRIQGTARVVETKLKSINYQIAELKTLGGKKLDEIQATIAELRIEREKYDKALTTFQTTRNALSEEGRVLLGRMSMAEFDKLIRKTRKEMQDSWTTRGLKTGMASLFSGIVVAMEQADAHAQRIKALVEKSYRHFQTEFGLPDLQPADFSLAPYLEQLRLVEKEAEAFRNSPAMAAIEQHFVIRRFFITIVARARAAMDECNQGVRHWFQAVMGPVFAQIQEHKTAMDRRLENLRRIQDNLDSVGTKITELDLIKKDLEGQRQTIRNLIARLQQP